MNFERLNIVDQGDLECIQISGRDRLDYLNRICSQKLFSTDVDQVLPAAFLSAGGNLIALFHIWVRESDFILVARKSIRLQLYKYLEDYNFGEDVQCVNLNEFKVCELRQINLIFADQTKTTKVGNGFVLPLEPWPLKKQNMILQRAYYLYKDENCSSVFSADDPIQLSSQEDYLQRAYAGVPIAPEEINEGNIILEGPFEAYVHRNKGCYPGQEVIERIFTYGNVAKRIISFEIEGFSGKAEHLKGAEINSDAGTVGQVLSINQFQDRALGFAIVKRLPIEKKHTLEVRDSSGSYRIFSLST